MSDKTTATIRTTVHGTVLSAICAVVFKVTGWSIKVEDLLPYTPITVPVIAVFYRASLSIADKFPSAGYVLFGNVTPPKY